MKKVTFILLCASLMAFCGCSDSDSNSDSNANTDNTDKPDTGDKVIAAGTHLKITSSITHTYSGNVESIRVVEGRALPSAVAVSSKSRTLHYLENDGTTLNNYHMDRSYPASDDDEYTNVAVIDEPRTLITKTILDKTDGQITACRGGIILFQGEGYDSFVVGYEVGSMPDAIAVSPDHQYIITADEHDSKEAWGKCPIASSQPSISIVKYDETASRSPLNLAKRVTFTRGTLGPREPEYVAFASDGDTVAVTLQDSHEVAIFSLRALLEKEGDLLTESDVNIYSLAKNAAGNSPWPDGIVSFDISGKTYFAMAGEANDTITIIDDKGNGISNPMITEKEVPTSYPCLKADDFATVKYSPDSITSFVMNDRTYIAATLRYAGAVILYDVTDPANPVFELITHAGVDEVIGTGVCKGYEEMTHVYPEGISSGKFGDSVYIWVANEGDNTVTSLKLDVK